MLTVTSAELKMRNRCLARTLMEHVMPIAHGHFDLDRIIVDAREATSSPMLVKTAMNRAGQSRQIMLLRTSDERDTTRGTYRN